MVEIAQTGNAEEGRDGAGVGQGWGQERGPCQQEKASAALIGFSLHPHVT